MTYKNLIEKMANKDNLPKYFDIETKEDISEEFYKAKYEYLTVLNKHLYSYDDSNLQKLVHLERIFQDINKRACLIQ